MGEWRISVWGIINYTPIGKIMNRSFELNYTHFNSCVMKNILVIDDNTISRFLIRKALEKKQRYFKLYITTSGKEAQQAVIDFYRKFKKLPDLIMISVDSSLASVLEFVQLINKQNLPEQWHRSIMVMSTPVNAHYPLLANEQPTFHFFPKPINSETLRKILSI